MIKKLLLFLLVFTSTYGFLVAQKIQKAEYFIDIDPGLGKGNPIAYSVSDTLVEEEFELNVSGLERGPHLLVIRTLSDNGVWSLSKSSKFYIEEAVTPPSLPKISIAEYFIDIDPGVGKGVSVDFDMEGDTVSKLFEIDISGLDAGAHSLVIRTKDTNGNWSIGKSAKFFVEGNYFPPSDTLLEIVEIEYFINDPDPGNGSATPIVIQSIGGEFLGTDSLDLSLTSLTAGRHYLLARVKDENGEWSLTMPAPFDYCTGEGLTAKYGYSRIENTLTLTDSSTNAVNYIWDMDNGDSLYAKEPVYTYNMGGVYEVCQTIYSFCDTNTYCQTILVPTPRVKDSISDQKFLEDTPKYMLSTDLNNVFEDLDGDPLTFDVVTNHPKLIAKIENGVGLSLEATDNIYGKLQVIVNAEGGGVKAYDTIKVHILSVNDAPEILEPIPDLIYDEDSGPRIVSNYLRKAIADPDDYKLDFVFTSDNPGIIPSIYSDSLRIRDTLEVQFLQDFNGIANLTITATDDSLVTTTHNFKITILSIDDAPRILKEIPNFNLNEDAGDVVLIDSLGEYFYEPEGDQINYSFIQNENEVMVYEADGQMKLQTILDFNGESEVIIEAESTALVTRDTFIINLNPRNDAPRFFDLNNLATCPENNFQIDLSIHSSDIDGADGDIIFSSKVLGSDNENVNISELDNFINGNNLIMFSKTKEAVIFDLQIGGKDGQQAVGYDTVQVKILGASFYQSNDTLFASEGNEYQWYLDGNKIDGANKSFFKGGGGGTFQVEITHDSCTIISGGGGITGIINNQISNELVLFPNPNKGLINIQFKNEEIGKGTIKIYTQTGKEVFVESFDKHKERVEKQFSIADLPNGFYFFEILFGNSRMVRKLLKE
ncbi:MAG: T9SS type A sorting domain-containing protein [Flammeovirgaceae bacterium]|nr:T9SS type A sorting domain-containing protein [Flammeovirgaceae bacterium]